MLRVHGSVFFIIVIALAFATQGDFLSGRNLTNLMRQTCINGILAAGMTMIILTGGIDLSIGSIVALAGVCVGLTQVSLGWATLGGGEESYLGAFASLGISVLVGLVFGFLNGALIAWMTIAPFVITLGFMVIGRGLTMILSNGASISPMSGPFASFASDYLSQTSSIIFILALFIFLGYLTVRNRFENWVQYLFPLLSVVGFSYAFLTYRGVPYLLVFYFACFVLIGFLLNSTVMGRSIYAIGSNERAAFWAGVSLTKVKLFIYSSMGALAGLSGALLTSRLNGAEPNAGQLFELDAIAAVVIGGTSLKGGTGHIMGSFIGALIIATLNNGMDLLGVQSFYQMVFKGIVIIVAVLVDKSQKSI